MRLFVLAGSLLLVAAAAQAQPAGQPYVAGSAGLNIAGSLAAGENAAFETDAGPAATGALGWAFGNGVRAELEGVFGSNGLGSIRTLRANRQLAPLSNESGNLRTYAALANVFYDVDPNLLPADLKPALRPYIGAGIGFGHLDLGDAHGDEVATFLLPGNNRFTGPAAVEYGSGNAVAYQAIAGAALPLDWAPGLEATCEYRYFGTARADIKATARSTGSILVNGSVPSGQKTLGLVAHDNMLLVGLRYRFGPP